MLYLFSFQAEFGYGYTVINVYAISIRAALLMTYIVYRKPITTLACLSFLLPLLNPIKSDPN